MTEPPETAEGWFVLHDFREVDWDAWRDAADHRREAAVAEGVDYLESHEAVDDAAEGDSAVFAVVGGDADLLVLHLRPSLDDLDRAQRQFEQTAFAAFTRRADSYVSVTEVSSYVSPAYFEDDAEVDAGIARYIQAKLEPDLPDAGYVSFYPMAKRRDAEHNWYDLDFEERADLMAGHGDIGREFAGRIQQIISGSVGFDDWEWGVTLFGDDPSDLKEIVYAMRFDEATSRYGEFGGFYVGARFPPTDLAAYMAGEQVPTDADGSETADESGGADADVDDAGDTGGRPSPASGDGLDVYTGSTRDDDVYAVALYSEADPGTLADAVYDLRSNFDHYDTHVRTSVYEPVGGDGPAAVVSLWDTERAADTASGFLDDLPGVIGRADDRAGWETMGMFYTVEPEELGTFRDRFDAVGDQLAEMEGHEETTLLANREDDTDMFIDSRWRSREDATEFFRSDAFADAVSWGRDVLVDRPRHVFLA